MTVMVLLLSTLLIAARGLPSAAAQVEDESPPPSVKNLEIWATSVQGSFVFVVHGGGTDIVLGEVPIILNITVRNTDPLGQVLHTFTIDDPEGNHLVNVELPMEGDVNSTSFMVSSPTELQIGNETIPHANATSVRAESRSDDQGTFIIFYCIPHRSVGMLGAIRVGTAAAAPAPYPGFQLWAFWIGVIAMLAMLAFIGVTYFVIKGSSRHHTDEREHLRRGLP
jgi:hypothetical protein